MYGYIYKTTNLINGKIYIGQKKSNIFLGEQYLGSGKKLHLAINKYGKENFKVELIEQCKDKEILNNKEKYWISYFNSIDKNIGYNIVKGGDGGDITSNYKWYNDGVKNYYIHLDDDVPSNLIKGRLNAWPPECNKGKIWINNGTEQHHIKKEDLNKYSDFTLGMLDRGEEWRKNIKNSQQNRSKETRKKLSESNKKFYQEHPNFRNSGNWKKGQIAFNKGLISITNGINNKYIKEIDLNYYINQGWWKGNTQHHNKKKSEV